MSKTLTTTFYTNQKKNFSGGYKFRHEIITYPWATPTFTKDGSAGSTNGFTFVADFASGYTLSDYTISTNSSDGTIHFYTGTPKSYFPSSGDPKYAACEVFPLQAWANHSISSEKWFAKFKWIVDNCFGGAFYFLGTTATSSFKLSNSLGCGFGYLRVGGGYLPSSHITPDGGNNQRYRMYPPLFGREPLGFQRFVHFKNFTYFNEFIGENIPLTWESQGEYTFKVYYDGDLTYGKLKIFVNDRLLFVFNPPNNFKTIGCAMNQSITELGVYPGKAKLDYFKIYYPLT